MSQDNSHNKNTSYLLIGGGLLTVFFGFGIEAFFPVLAGGAVTFLGLRMNRNSHKQQSLQQNQARQFEMNDEMIIRLAKRLGGKLSVEELASQTSLTREEAKERLEKLHHEGVCQMDLNEIEESGKIYYHF